MIRSNLITLSIVSSLLVGCGSIDNNTNINNVDSGIIGLDEIVDSDYDTQENIEDMLIGINREDLIDVWGEADGSLSGLYGDIWDLSDGYRLLVYYDDVDSNKVTKVNIYNIDEYKVNLGITEISDGILKLKLDTSELGIGYRMDISYDLEYNNGNEWEYIGDKMNLGEFESGILDTSIDLYDTYGELNGEYRLNMYIDGKNGDTYSVSGNFIIGEYGLVWDSEDVDSEDERVVFGIVGVIESINRVGEDISLTVSSRSSKSTYDKAVVKIKDTTKLDGVDEQGLVEGMEVEVEFDGVVLESYPVQSNAKSVKLLTHDIEI